MNILKANKMSNDILLTRGDSVYLAVRSKVIVYPDNYTVVWLSLASRYYKVLWYHFIIILTQLLIILFKLRLYYSKFKCLQSSLYLPDSYFWWGPSSCAASSFSPRTFTLPPGAPIPIQINNWFIFDSRRGCVLVHLHNVWHQPDQQQNQLLK